MDGSRAALGLKGAVEDRQVLDLDEGGAFNSPVLVNELEYGAAVALRVTELGQRGPDGVVDDLDHPAADQLLEFYKGQVRLHSGRVAIHHEADRAGRGQHRRLSVSETVNPPFQ